MTRGHQQAADQSAHHGPEQGQRGATRGWIRLGAVAGVAGPVAFTLAWVVGSFMQPGESFTAVQISGLAADNARDPWIMIAGFVLLGCCAVLFGAVLRRALGGWPRAGLGPAAIQAAGVCTLAVGLLRRDHVLLTGGPPSWHNQAHDVVSAIAYVLLIAAPLLIAGRLRRDREWHGLAVALAASALLSAGVLVFFYSAPHSSWDGLLQRIAVSLPLAAIAALSGRLAVLSRPEPSGPG